MWYPSLAPIAVALLTVVVTLAGCAESSPRRTARFDIAASPTTADDVQGGGTVTAATPAVPSLNIRSGPATLRPSDYKSVDGLKTVHFDYDQFDVRAADLAILDRNAGWLVEHPGARVLIEAHADERGTAEYNVALSDKRARTTKSYLISKGIRADRVAVIGYGEERPLCLEATAACYARNRRASFLVAME